MFLRALFLLLAALVRLLRVHLLLLLLLRVAALRFLAGMTVLLVFHDRDPVDKGHAAAKCRRTVTLVPERLIAGEKAVICSRLFSCVQPAQPAAAAHLDWHWRSPLDLLAIAGRHAVVIAAGARVEHAVRAGRAHPGNDAAIAVIDLVGRLRDRAGATWAGPVELIGCVGCGEGSTCGCGRAACGGGTTGCGATVVALRVAVGLDDVGTWACATSGSRAINNRGGIGFMARSDVDRLHHAPAPVCRP
ncbi:hypothetical protein SM139_2855 [Stenotrophomonas maltophilia]|nr:hypothetical protein SM139_2855 [Stenotrophomonas maltophilia]